ncbi:ABC-type multidrug transport system, permease component [Streptococcus gordonii]|uniref:ABC-type multidrug transport system, permease component n=1 Tax=Streptococcus gordonii TaxID=1302 RepID=A0A139MYD2_STRGN|nr:ABC-type multidrug transport system, permease component [Streptococcus gordonii]
MVGGILLATTFSSITWTLPKFLLFLICIPFTTLIYTSLKIATASIAFWTKRSGAMIYILGTIYQFTLTTRYSISDNIKKGDFLLNGNRLFH